MSRPVPALHPKPPQKTYPPEFKQNAVKLITEFGRSYTNVAAQLGCTPQSIRHWVKVHHAQLEPQKRTETIQATEQLRVAQKDALKQAIIVRKGMPLDILFHSDRGVQFTATEFRSCLSVIGISQSMSRKGDCWDNAPCESFFGKLKSEWFNHCGVFATVEQVRLAVFEYIDGYYFNTRRHPGLGYRTPREVEESYFAKLTTQAGGV